MKIEALEGKRESKSSGHAVMSVYLTQEMHEELIRIAREEDVKKSVLVRYIFELFIEEYNEK